MWGLRTLTPDFKTLADFRTDKARALKEVCRALTLFCQKLDLCGQELIAIDGSKVNAVHRKDRHVTEPKLQPFRKRLHEKIDTYLNE